MLNRIISVLTIIFIITSCSIFQKDTFQGAWTMSITGDYNDSVEFIVAENNTFSFTKNISTQGQNYDARFNGKILEDGTMVCDVEVMSMKVVQFNGKMTYENGSGKWAGTGMNGSWTAVKK
jgi:hypothetical protein